MTALPPTTRRRLNKIPQTPGVWEGDRRPLGSMASHLDANMDGSGECIIWVDGSEGSIRAMDIVPAHMGIEAVVRTLLRAIESPHHPAQPCRPQKVIVRDREIQFFLRGALQDLNINVEYVPHLPLIERLFQGFEEISSSRPPSLPPLYETALENIALKILKNAPWELLADSDILEIELKKSEIERVYVCVMGMMSAEYGVLLYRSLESLKQFRAVALEANKSSEELEQAFLAQDCWFLNYEQIELEEPNVKDEDFAEVKITPFFGSLHPYEGMRSFLDEEEAKLIYAALETLWRFCQRNRHLLAQEPLPTISKSFRISLPSAIGEKNTLTTKISTLPEVSAELLAIGIDNSDRTDLNIPIQEDLIPNGSLVTLGSIPWELVELFKTRRQIYHQSLNISPQGTELPTILIQTTRPKAKTLIERIKNAGGLKAVCFNPGQDPYSGDIYDLGMLQTGNGELYIFAEYSQDIPQHLQAVKRWHRSCQKNKGYCGLIVAMGATGGSRGNPQPKDMLALFEVKAVDGEELGMGILELMPDFEF